MYHRNVNYFRSCEITADYNGCGDKPGQYRVNQSRDTHNPTNQVQVQINQLYDIQTNQQGASTGQPII